MREHLPTLHTSSTQHPSHQSLELHNIMSHNRDRPLDVERECRAVKNDKANYCALSFFNQI